MGCLYALTWPSGKQYIGITLKTAEERFAFHLKHCGDGRRNAVHRAILKYGPNAVTITTLVVSNDPAYLRAVERRAIKAYGTMAPGGYNLSGGGEDFAFWATESRDKLVAGLSAAWQRKPAQERRRITKKATDAMKTALSDPAVERARRAKISATMLSSGVGRGEANAQSKLTASTVVAIREACATRTQQSVADEFNVSRRLVGLIKRRERWRHI